MTAVVRPRRFVEPSALPGFGPALGFTMVYLSFFLLLPLAALVLRPWEHGFGHVWSVITERRTLDALKLSFGAAFFAAASGSWGTPPLNSEAESISSSTASAASSSAG